jgi:hypothetical protein
MIDTLYEQVLTPGAGLAAVAGFVLGTLARTAYSATHLGKRRP